MDNWKAVTVAEFQLLLMHFVQGLRKIATVKLKF
jgi:hypothetical protein